MKGIANVQDLIEIAKMLKGENLLPYLNTFKNKCGIYAIVNLFNNKVYIGSTISIRKRWTDHRSNLRNGYHKNQYLQNSWDKHGEVNFVMCVIELCDKKDLVSLSNREDYWINLLKSCSRGTGYNLKSAGEHPLFGEETRRKIRNAKLGTKHSEATKLKIRLAKVGVKHSSESKRNMSVGQQNKWASGWKPSLESVRRSIEKRTGQKRTEEFKKRLSEITKRNNKSKRHIVMLDMNGAFIKEFGSIADAARFLGIVLRNGSSSHIVDAANGRKKSAYGYMWRYTTMSA